MRGLPQQTARRLHSATAGNPLALLELAADAPDLALAPDGAPILVSARISRAFLHRAGTLDPAAQRALVLAATSDTGDLPTLERAAAQLGIDLAALTAAEGAGLVTLRAWRGGVPPSAGPVGDLRRRACQRAARRAPGARRRPARPGRRPSRLAPGRRGDGPGRTGVGGARAGGHPRPGPQRVRDRGRGVRAGRAARGRRASGAPGCCWQAAEAGWLAGLTDRAVALLDEARASTGDPATLVEIDQLAGHIATRRGPVMRGHAILTAAAGRADPERAVAMLAEAAFACFIAGNPAEMLSVAERARARLPGSPSVRARFLAAIAVGMARILGGDAAAGAEAVHEAITLAETSAELREDLQLMPWLVLGPLFLRETDAGRPLLEHALRTARAPRRGRRPAVRAQPDRPRPGRYRPLGGGRGHLPGGDRPGPGERAADRADLRARRARLAAGPPRAGGGMPGLCRRGARPAAMSSASGCTRSGRRRRSASWSSGSATPPAPPSTSSVSSNCCDDLAITDADLSPAAELVDAYLRLGRGDEARQVAARFTAAASAKGQPWSLARAPRCQGLLAGDDGFAAHFEQALSLHEQTPDAFETARTRLAYGERLRRARNRVLAREQLRAAADAFERLDARPWAERARAELAATGETHRRRDPSTIDELTPQELQIALLLTAGKTTREAAAALFLSPKTVEYHLRHVYQKLGIHYRERARAGARRANTPLGVLRAAA